VTELIDITVPLRDGMVLYDGNPGIALEGVNLGDVEPGPYRLVCLPLKVVGSDGAPGGALLERD
jgi:arylformamidase